MAAIRLIVSAVRTVPRLIKGARPHALAVQQAQPAMLRINPVREIPRNIFDPGAVQNIGQLSTGVRLLTATTLTSTVASVQLSSRTSTSSENIDLAFSTMCFNALESDEQGMLAEFHQRRALESISDAWDDYVELLGSRYDNLFAYDNPVGGILGAPSAFSMRGSFLSEAESLHGRIFDAIGGGSRKSGGNDYSTKKRKKWKRG